MSDHVSIRIEAPHFVAGVELHDGIVRETAPILHYMLGWTRKEVIEYAERKHWFHSGETR